MQWLFAEMVNKFCYNLCADNFQEKSAQTLKCLRHNFIATKTNANQIGSTNSSLCRHPNSPQSALNFHFHSFRFPFAVHSARPSWDWASGAAPTNVCAARDSTSRTSSRSTSSSTAASWRRSTRS